MTTPSAPPPLTVPRQYSPGIWQVPAGGTSPAAAPRPALRVAVAFSAVPAPTLTTFAWLPACRPTQSSVAALAAQGARLPAPTPSAICRIRDRKPVAT